MTEVVGKQVGRYVSEQAGRQAARQLSPQKPPCQKRHKKWGTAYLWHPKHCKTQVIFGTARDHLPSSSAPNSIKGGEFLRSQNAKIEPARQAFEQRPFENHCKKWVGAQRYIKIGNRLRQQPYK